MPAKSEEPTKRGSARATAKQTPSFMPTPSSPRKTRAMTRTVSGATDAVATAPAAQATRKATNPKPKPKAATARVPFISRDNSPEQAPRGTTKGVQGYAKGGSDAFEAVVPDDDQEPIKAFLRIRPNLGHDQPASIPYLKSLSSTMVQMSEPSSSSPRFRQKSNVTSTYTFSHVFPPETVQAEFFAKTTLPLVRSLMDGQNGLVFTYGVTNSGKTYTIQGGNEPDTTGLLPRTLDVVFNSLDGLHSNTPYKPVRVAGVERVDGLAAQDLQYRLPESADTKAMASIFPDESRRQGSDSTKLTVDRNYEYSVWISYVEIYNEKVFDLLSADKTQDEMPTINPNDKLARTGTHKQLPRASTWQSIAALTTSNSSSSDVLLVKRKALVLKSDVEGGKYAAGLNEVCVRSAEEAKALFRAGMINRRVFGTLANSASSRSHSIFTIKLLKIHRGARDDTDSVISSRLSIVDLAGSERTKNTQNTGDRLREAGSINKSLMVLGQCMEALRNNQKRQAASAAALALPGRGSIRPFDTTSSRVSIVPFRHSKLTELFQDFFVGERDGRAVMIVNVNPYDTGFDENSHVMKFAALAREVKTTTTNIPVAKKIAAVGRDSVVVTPYRRKVTIETRGKRHSEVHLEIVEENGDDEDDDEPINPLVETLFDEVEELRSQLYEAQLQSAMIEAETREEVMKEMEERMLNMERIFMKRLRREAEQHAMKADAKIDMLHQFGAFSSKANADEETETEDDEEVEEFDDEVESTIDSSNGRDSFDFLGETISSSRGTTTSPSPTRPRTKGKQNIGFQHMGTKPEKIGLMEDEMSVDELDADETMTKDGWSETDDGDEEKPDEEESSTIESEDGDWAPSTEENSPAMSVRLVGAIKPVATASDSQTPRAVKTQASPASKSRHSVQLSSIRERMERLRLAHEVEDEEDEAELHLAGITPRKNPGQSRKSTRQSARKVI